MANLILNPVEMAILQNEARRGDPDENYSDFLQTLESLCDKRTGGMHISKTTLAQIQEFGLDRRNPRWQAILFSVFRRTLGDHLGRDRDDSGSLVKHEDSEPQS